MARLPDTSSDTPTLAEVVLLLQQSWPDYHWPITREHVLLAIDYRKVPIYEGRIAKSDLSNVYFALTYLRDAGVVPERLPAIA